MSGTLHDIGQLRSISAVTVLVLLLVWESSAPFAVYFVGNSGERLRHGLKNLVLGILNALLTGLVFVALWWTTAEWAQAQNFGLLNWLSFPGWAHVVGAFLLFDAWMYFWHRLNHRVPFLWRFHRTHHSDPRMDVTTANRFHLGEIFLLIDPTRTSDRTFGPGTVGAGSLRNGHVHRRSAPPCEHCIARLAGSRFACAYRDALHAQGSPFTLAAGDRLELLVAVFVLGPILRNLPIARGPETLQFGLEEFDRPEHHTLIGLFTTPVKQIRRTIPQRPRQDDQSLR